MSAPDKKASGRAPDGDHLLISVHGPGATIESAIEVGEATKKLLAEVARGMGVPDGALEWRIGSIQFQCDGCGLERPDRPGPDEGWTFEGGDDFCPACTKARARAAGASSAPDTQKEET